MEDERDLRFYIDVLMRHWILIAAVTLLAGAAALAVSTSAPTRYQANAVVLVTRPLYQFQFSPEIQNLTSTQQVLAGKVAVELATTDSLLQQLLLELGDVLPAETRNLASLRGMLNATTGSDSLIVNLGVTNRDARRVAHIANTWAGLYVRHINDLYGPSADQLRFFEEQEAQAQQDLDEADRALIEFQRRSDLIVLQAQLTAKQSALSDYLALNESLVQVQQNLNNLRDQLSGRPADAPSGMADALTQLMLQLTVFSAPPVSPAVQSQLPGTGGLQVTVYNAPANGLPLQLQLPVTSTLSGRTVGQQAAELEGLARTVESKLAEAKKQAEVLPVEIKALQGQVQEASTEAASLMSRRELALNVYTTLAQKVQETRITAQEAAGRVKLASSAAVPQRPVSKRLLTNTAAGLALGFLAVVAVVFAIEYLRRPAKMPSDPGLQQPPQ